MIERMEKIIPYLKTVSNVAPYQLYLEFEDGVSGVVDLSIWKGKGVFEYWNNVENFKNFKIISLGKLEWNNEIDMDPDALYLKLIGKTFQEYANDKQLLRHTD